MTEHARIRTATAGELGPALVLDHAVSEHVTVRSWDRRAATPIAGRPGAHDGMEIAWFRRGAARYSVGSRTFEVPAGSVAIVPAFMEHTTVFLTEVEAGVLCVSRSFVDQVLDACGHKPGVLGAGALDGGRILALGREVELDAKEAGAGQLLAVDSLAEVMIARLSRFAAGMVSPDGSAQGKYTTVVDRRIRAAIDLMENHYDEPLAVDGLAKAANMSRFHFSRAFREATGLAPYSYLIDLRVRRAAELLRAGHHSVTEAAFAVGFSDLGRFARAFRAKTGRAPRDVARDARHG